MDDFQFIIESPQTNQSQRKRPRLVTSCDNCRLKKIKCLQPYPDSKCDACSQAKVSCRFRDRERYFVERSRAIAGPTARAPCGDIQPTSTSSSSHPSGHLSGPPHDEFPNLLDDQSFETFSTDHSDTPFYPVHSRSQTLPSGSTPSSLVKSGGTNSGTATPVTYGLVDSPVSLDLSPNSDSLQQFQPPSEKSNLIPLFDPKQPQSPHSSLVPHFIQVFVKHLGTQCPFITYDDALERFMSGILPPLLANSIASLAARFTDMPDLVSRGVDNVSLVYGEKAKDLLTPALNIPSVETLHALMLLSWSEYKSGRISGFRHYCEMAMRMALDLGLSTDNAMRLNISERGRNQLRITWSSVVQLNFFASTCV